MTKNPLGYTMLTEDQHSALFRQKRRNQIEPSDVNRIADELRRYGIDVPVVQDVHPSISTFSVPAITKPTIYDTVEDMARTMLDWRLEELEQMAALKPTLPEVDFDRLGTKTGWIDLQTYENVPYPDSRTMVCDVETFVTKGNFVVMAAALTVDGRWFLWLHPDLYGEYETDCLLPMGPGRLIVNHAVTFDAMRFAESYDLQERQYLLDTMSITNLISGFGGRQRWALSKRQQQTLPPWAYVGHGNSLVETYEHYCRHEAPFAEGKKELRDIFVYATSMAQIRQDLHALIQYNIRDVYYTQRVLYNAYPKFRKKAPSLTTLYGLMASTSFRFPVIDNWYEWIDEVDAEYERRSKEASDALREIAVKWVEEGYDSSAQPGDPTYDPWKSQLDWTIKPRARINKGMPEWFRRMGDLTTKSHLANILLKLKWDGHPIYYVKKKGICFGPNAERIPRDEGGNLASLLTKEFNDAFEARVITSGDPETSENVLRMSTSLTYWTSVQSRVKAQYAMPGHMPDGTPSRFVVPNLRGGTITGRVTDNLWLTVSSTKSNKVGTELKSRIQTPPGWTFIHGDHSSQEIRIAAILGDKVNGLVGSSMMSYSILVGDKNKGTDTHSIQARGIAEAAGVESFPRVHAKTVGFAVLYMGGVKTTKFPIRHGLPHLSWEECEKIAAKALVLRKGRKKGGRYEGGTDSAAFNEIDRICNQKRPRTPLLKREMPDTICPEYTGADFYTSRGNWVIQASARDQLDVFLTTYDYQAKKLGVMSHVCWAYHDEMLALSRDEDSVVCSDIFQVAHAYTWAALHEAVGLNDMSLGGLLFDSIEIDRIFRKEADESTLSPSQRRPEPDGVCLTPKDFTYRGF